MTVSKTGFKEEIIMIKNNGTLPLKLTTRDPCLQVLGALITIKYTNYVKIYIDKFYKHLLP